MQIFATLLAALLLAAALTRLYMRLIKDRRFVAQESHRSMHKGEVAVGGGWPLLTAALLVSVLLWPLGAAHSVLIPALATLAVISWWDDIGTLSPGPRLAVHSAAAALCLWWLPAGVLVLQGWLPLWLDRAVAFLALVWWINLYNFMDGIDGIAGTETASIALGYVAVTLAAGAASPLLGLALATAGASLGFLFSNWHPARIFMGDVGAIPLGFLTGWLLFDLAVHHSLAAAVILPLYYATDATLTLVKRIAHGERPWEPHRSHAYQRAARGLGSHAAVVKRIVLCNLVLIAAAVLSLTQPLAGVAIAVAAVAALMLSLEHAAREAGD
jgi:UDP-N-acetylmuramyl pentapeptide phosphotransferase/UDP-N-acetylglucosamine-1-phosphate transferase